VPELPEVETMVRGMRQHVVGRRVEALRRCRCSRKPISIQPAFRRLARRVAGNEIQRVRRLAKRVVFEFASRHTLVIEPRMTGLFLFADPPSREHLRLEWRFAGRGDFSRLWYWDRRGLGTVRLYEPGEIDVALGPDKLGPDPLRMSDSDWQTRCGGTKRPIKLALLDQKWVGGIGNLYASEILHAAGIHPETRTDQLSTDDICRLTAAVRNILREAIAYEGSTLNDVTYRNVLNRKGRYQSRHRVYRRAGMPCLSCREGDIQRIVQSQRSTFFCPACQPGGRSR